MFANAPLYHGPLIGLIGSGDISIYVGFVVAALAYYALMRSKIGAPALAQVGPADALADASAGAPADAAASQPRRDIGAVTAPRAEEAS